MSIEAALKTLLGGIAEHSIICRRCRALNHASINNSCPNCFHPYPSHMHSEALRRIESNWAGKVASVETLDHPPIVGVTYLVESIKHPDDDNVLHPVIMARHEDESLGFPDYHFHFDTRFTGPETRFEYLFTNELLRVIVVPKDTETEVYRLPMICRKDIIRYPRRATHLKDLNRDFEGARIKCGKCPHRGMPLGSLPRIECEGHRNAVECPGHGLKFDLDTGMVIK